MYEKFGQFIDGKWQQSSSGETYDVINPATEEVMGTIAMGDQDDVDAAVNAAQDAFISFSQTTVDERVALLQKIVEIYMTRSAEIAEIISLEILSLI